MNRLGKILARTGLLVLWVIAPASAQAAARLRSEVEARQFHAGESVAWTLTVEGAGRAEAFGTPASPDFLVRAGEPQVFTKGAERTFVFRYRLVPRRTGALQLPTFTAFADEKKLESEALTLNVEEPESSVDQRLEVHFERREVYLGQPVALTFTWLSALPLEAIRAVDIRLPLLYDPAFQVIAPAPERRALRESKTIGVPVEGQRMFATLSSIEINGRRFSALTFKRIFIPKRAGEFVFPAARLFCLARPESISGDDRAPKKSSTPGYFDNDFFLDATGQEGYLHYDAKASDLALTVRPLPESGRPAQFSGIVGTGKLLAQAEPATLKIGDPVTLTVRLRDFPWPEALALPAIGTLTGISGAFQIPGEQSPGRVVDGDAVFVQSMRPLRCAITGIPPLSLVIFNPEAGQYQTLTSALIPLQIKADGAVTAINPEAVSGPSENPAGIWHNLPAGEVDPLTRASGMLRRSALAWLMLPWVAYVACAGAARRFRLKHTDPQRWRQQTAFASLKRTLKSAATPQAQRLLVGRYLAVRLGISEGALSYQEILRALQARRIELEEEPRTVLITLFHCADLERFGGEKAAEWLPAARVLQGLHQLERRL